MPKEISKRIYLYIKIINMKNKHNIEAAIIVVVAFLLTALLQNI